MSLLKLPEVQLQHNINRIAKERLVLFFQSVGVIVIYLLNMKRFELFSIEMIAVP